MRGLAEPACFSCGKEIGFAYRGVDLATSEDPLDTAWSSPSEAVLFEGGYNYGSTVYDAFVDNILVQVVICDDCLRKAKGTNRLREHKTSPKSKA